jgi:curved DNA-binding protein CbpA
MTKLRKNCMYDRLLVKPNSSYSEIKINYLLLSSLFNPLRHSSDKQQFCTIISDLIAEAWIILGNRKQRKLYNILQSLILPEITHTPIIVSEELSKSTTGNGLLSLNRDIIMRLIKVINDINKTRAIIGVGKALYIWSQQKIFEWAVEDSLPLFIF